MQRMQCSKLFWRKSMNKNIWGKKIENEVEYSEVQYKIWS